MFDVRGLNVAIELWGVAFCILGIVCALLFAPTEGRNRRLVLLMFAMELLACGGDALAGIFRGRAGSLAWTATHLGNFVTFASNFTLIALFTTYAHVRLEQAGQSKLHPWRTAVWVATAVMYLLAALGVFYHIDDQNLYHRSSLYWLTYAHTLLVCVANAVLVLRSRHQLGAAVFTPLMVYLLLTATAMGAQVLVYGLNFVSIAGVLGSVVLFLETRAYSARLLAERTQELARSRVEVSESRIAIMVSQIQPHFLFNTLDTIYYLCTEDPPRAQEAVDRFSTYLRANLASLRKIGPVPIETELEHVRTYLELEELSMEDLLTWKIDAKAGGFLVPALSLQTLTENAVKHGIGGRTQGGHVIVRTRESHDCWLASVEDDGVGFDTSAPLAEGQVGLENTKMRLASMCGGTLLVTSSPGRGTTVVMRIPKEVAR